jgi:hypothetical protein
MSDLFATDDYEIDEALTASIAEVFFAAYGLVLPAHVAITITGHIILRPFDGRSQRCCAMLN